MDQQTFFNIEPSDHLDMIQSRRVCRDQIRKRMVDHFEVRQKIADRMNEAIAARDDAIDGKAPHKTAAELVEIIRKRQAEAERCEAEMAEALELQKQLRASLQAAQTDLELSIAGIQRTVIEAIAEVQPAKHETAQSLRTARQRSVADACVKALAGLGGRAACVDLASLVGVSSHGLGGLIDWDPRMRKRHDGRLNNTQTIYELAD